MIQQKTLPYYSHIVAGQELLLLPEKAIFWKEKKILLVADLHIGKAAHFRKAGIPISAKIHQHDFSILYSLVEQWQPVEVIFLGDLFHSSYNSEWEQLQEWMDQHDTTRFTLIKGNHDILPEAVYSNSSLQLVRDKMEIFPFLLTHHPPDNETGTAGTYVLCGHIHPAVQLSGAARQQISLPCFYFGLHYGVLPAFGKFTGFYKIKPKVGERVFGVLPERVIPLNQ